MKTTQWLSNVIATGDLCERYAGPVASAHNKLGLMRLALSGGAAGYLCEMQAKGMGLDSSIIAQEFAAYINGKYIAEFTSENGSYDSTMYCQWNDMQNLLLLASTLTTFIDCKASLILADYSYHSVYCDADSQLVITCPPTAFCDVHCWRESSVQVQGSAANVRIILHANGRETVL